MVPSKKERMRELVSLRVSSDDLGRQPDFFSSSLLHISSLTCGKGKRCYDPNMLMRLLRVLFGRFSNLVVKQSVWPPEMFFCATTKISSKSFILSSEVPFIQYIFIQYALMIILAQPRPGRYPSKNYGLTRIWGVAGRRGNDQTPESAIFAQWRVASFHCETPPLPAEFSEWIFGMAGCAIMIYVSVAVSQNIITQWRDVSFRYETTPFPAAFSESTLGTADCAVMTRASVAGSQNNEYASTSHYFTQVRNATC